MIRGINLLGREPQMLINKGSTGDLEVDWAIKVTAIARILPKRNFEKCAPFWRVPLLFLDRTHARARRWCSMSICGNRAKQAAHRKRSPGKPESKLLKRAKRAAPPNSRIQRSIHRTFLIKVGRNFERSNIRSSQFADGLFTNREIAATYKSWASWHAGCASKVKAERKV